ncbi:glycosyltransferase [Ferviditalea candida]|uniref:Glycosyltransferase n=1 Tax=Ferviditalea candida TaxID=3108399 RepID=A0ABU5ZGI8_9BACL|nr:glycosyltransferase [Paenibacillaceae bacterium T2]
MSVKVSVIIPVYNAEPYIAQCIESLQKQTLHACEFIFINDGSTDNSGAIIEDYRKSDGRILLIEQENRGVSAARNKGLEAVSGEYIGFVDADDWIEADMYEKLYSAAKRHDVDAVLCNFEEEIDGHQVITRFPFPVNVKLGRDDIEEEFLPYFLKTDKLNSAVNKIYKNRIVRDSGIKFPDEVALGEDGMFNIRFFSRASSFQYIDYTGYHYREVAGSATRNISDKDYFKRALEVFAQEIPEIPAGKLRREEVIRLKAIKLIHNVMAYIHIYLRPSKEMSFGRRYRYVKHMIEHHVVRNALPQFFRENYPFLGRYEKVLLHLIRRKSVIGLYCITGYSRLRAKSYRRNGS